MRVVPSRTGAPICGALFVSQALFLALLLTAGLAPSVAAASPCASDRIDQTAVVAHVHDGDTVSLADGRKLRLIGINTPEAGAGDRAPEPLADAATVALRGLLGAHAEIGLRLDASREDRHGRMLAHVYTKSGASVTAWLLERGFGSQLVVPPNLWNEACYRAAEAHARRARRGVWGLPGYVTDAASLGLDASGYRVLTGTVRRATRTSRFIHLHLDGHVVVRILPGDLRYFDARTFVATPVYWRGRRVEVRGWLRRYKDHLYMQIRHPAALTAAEGSTP